MWVCIFLRSLTSDFSHYQKWCINIFVNYHRIANNQIFNINNFITIPKFFYKPKNKCPKWKSKTETGAKNQTPKWKLAPRTKHQNENWRQQTQEYITTFNRAKKFQKIKFSLINQIGRRLWNANMKISRQKPQQNQ